MTCFDQRTKSPAGRSSVAQDVVERRAGRPAEHADRDRRGGRLRTGQPGVALDVVEARPDGQGLVERRTERTAGQGVLGAGGVLAAGLVDDRRGHRGELRGREVLPDPGLEALGDEQVAVAVDALQATAPGGDGGLAVAGRRRGSRAAAARR